MTTAAWTLPSGGMDRPVIQVAIGICRREDGALLVTRRHAHAALPDLWEFPGGKLEPDESPRHAALRELREELGVEAMVLAMLEPVRHAYDDFDVVLHPFLCRIIAGEPAALASQEVRWTTLDALSELAMPAANATLLPRMVAALRHVGPGLPW